MTDKVAENDKAISRTAFKKQAVKNPKLDFLYFIVLARVSVQGVESLWGDCRFFPADWGS